MGEFIEFTHLSWPGSWSWHYPCNNDIILCFHCHAIKNKKCKPFNTEIENRRNKRRASPKIRFVWYYTCEIFGRMFCPNLQSFVGRQHGAQILRLETNKNMSLKFFLQKREYITGGTRLKWYSFWDKECLDSKILKKSVTILTHIRAFPDTN